MLTLSSEENHSLGDISKQRYTNKITAHFIQTYPPDTIKTWGYSTPEELNQKVMRGIEKASSYGFVTELDQFDYLECLMELGENFDHDPKYPWASAIVLDSDGHDRGSRLTRALELQLSLRIS